MFEPARLWTGWRPSAASTAAIIPAVVVLPLVALTTVVPPRRPAPRRAIASGSSRSSTRPGRVVPPPRPLARLAAPIAREAATLAPNSGPGAALWQSRRGQAAAGTSTLSARGSTRSEAGRSVRCSPSA